LHFAARVIAGLNSEKQELQYKMHTKYKTQVIWQQCY